MFEDYVPPAMLTQEEIDLVKRSLHCYSDMLRRIEESERVTSHELASVTELQHRLGTHR